MDLFILKTDGEKFTSTNKKTLHLIFKATLKQFTRDVRASKVYRKGVHKISPVSIYGEIYGGKDLRDVF